MEKYLEPSTEKFINQIPKNKPAVMLLRLWDKSEQEVTAIQRQAQKQIHPEISEKTIDAVQYSYD